MAKEKQKQEMDKKIDELKKDNEKKEKTLKKKGKMNFGWKERAAAGLISVVACCFAGEHLLEFVHVFFNTHLFIGLVFVIIVGLCVAAIAKLLMNRRGARLHLLGFNCHI